MNKALWGDEFWSDGYFVSKVGKFGDEGIIVKEDDVRLYNLEQDLGETTNVAEEYPEITQSMREAIEEFKAEVVPGS